MAIGVSRRIRPRVVIGLAAIAVVLTGCFQTAGDSIAPTSVNLTSIATVNLPPTPFVTPLSTDGFVPPTDDPNQLNVQPTDPPPIEPTLDQQLPTQPVDVAPPTEMPTLAELAPGGLETPTNDGIFPPTLTFSGPAAPVPTSTLQMFATPTALPTEGPCVHTVQPGEWLYSIARKYNIQPQDLLNVNPSLARNPDSLAPGDVLNIPNCNQQAQAQPTAIPTDAQQNPPAAPPTTAPDAGAPTPILVSERSYTVVSGDTLGGIARKFGTTVKDLEEINGLTSDALSIGQVLKIRKSSRRVAPALQIEILTPDPLCHEVERGN